MKSLIKKVIKESEDFDWIREIPPFELGDFLSNAEVCDDSGDRCDVNINLDENEIVFVLDYDDWKQFVGMEDNYIIDNLFRGDGQPDHYSPIRGEMNYDEINYLYYNLTDEQRNRFNEILKVITNNKITVGDLENDNFGDIELYLLHPELKKMWNYFVYDYLSPIEEALEINTWSSLNNYYNGLLKIDGVGIELDYYGRSENIKITIPINFLNKNGILNLSDAIEKITEPFVQDWWEFSYQEYDTAGSEEAVNLVINNFLNYVEEFLEEENFEPYQDFLKILKKLDFSKPKDIWVEGFGRKLIFTKKIDEDFFVGVSPKIDDFGDNVYIVIQNKSFTSMGVSGFNSVIPIDEIGEFIYNYKLDFEK